MIRWEEDWAEAFSIFFLALGFILAVLLKSSYYSYLTVFLSGLVAGRLFYIKRFKEPILPFVLIILGFLVGYLIGSLWVSRILIILFFAGGFYLSYYLHKKKILGIFKNELYVK